MWPRLFSSGWFVVSVLGLAVAAAVSASTTLSAAAAAASVQVHQQDEQHNILVSTRV